MNKQIRAILDLGRKIYIEYSKIQQNTSKPNIQNLIHLLDLEEEHIKYLKLDEQTTAKIIEFSKENIKKELANLPYGIESSMNYHDYPFYRLLANIQNDPLDSLNNLKIGLLYNSLMMDKTSTIKDRAYQILVNSHVIERQALTNNLQPLEEVYDTIDFSQWLESLYTALISKSKLETPVIDSEEAKISYYITSLMDLVDYLNRTKFLINNDSAQKIVIKSYLNALTAILDEDDLDSMCFNSLSIIQSPEIKNFVMGSFYEAPKLMSFKRTVTFLKPKE